VAVIGGGSVAIDSARVALRSGAEKVYVICLECFDRASRDRMPAQSREIKEAEEEGITILPSRGVHKILAENNQVTGIETMNCISVRRDDGSFAPKYDQCSLDILEVDSVIVAIGQTVDKSALGGLLHTAGGIVKADHISLETNLPGVFAGGDLTFGAADIISAVAAGKQAAVSIDRHLRGIDLKKGRWPVSRSGKEKVQFKVVSGSAWKYDGPFTFNELASGIEENLALAQAQRCVQCGVTIPSVVIKPEDPKKQIVPWNADKALSLWQKRHPENGEVLPDIFKIATDITGITEDAYLRNKLVLKPKDTAELMNYTTDDE
jgi:hypothetical protein